MGGSLGGTLFTIKWLYHVVARELWNLDQRLWRLFTPHISGGLAFAVIALVSSGMMKIFDVKATHSPSVVVGMAFLVGYFSDNAVAKLTEIAATLSEHRGRKRNISPSLPETRRRAQNRAFFGTFRHFFSAAVGCVFIITSQ